MKPMHAISHLFKPGEMIKDTYEIDRFIGEGAFAEVYRAKHKYLGLQALKIMKPGILRDVDHSSFISEATILSKFTHPNIVRVFEANSFERNKSLIFFIAMEFISGENLFQLMKRKIRVPFNTAINIQREICAGLAVAHNLKPPLIHRDIKPHNILLHYESDMPTAKVSDFGVSKIADPKTNMTNSAGTITYLPPEGFWNFHTPASDVFSAGIIFYQMITGMAPWLYDFSNINMDNNDEIETAVLKSRKTSPQKPSSVNQNCDAYLSDLILKSISEKPENRFKNAIEFLNVLIEYENRKRIGSASVYLESSISAEIKSKDSEKGFASVAGMSELKDLLYTQIILPIQEKELFEKYRITLPNGILLYGPPGCGKTFIARKLSEEISYNFIDVRPSDLASTYIHGSQEKIGKLFKKAREKSPSIIFIDEIDAIIPKRDERIDHHYSSEVNEILTQLNECGKQNIVVIGATNRIDHIDPAALRTGRFDKLIYVPPPDYDARIELFNIFLKNRPLASDIKVQNLASITNNFVASDIETIVNQAAIDALKSRKNITHDLIVKSIKGSKPSVSTQMIKEYEIFREHERK